MRLLKSGSQNDSSKKNLGISDYKWHYTCSLLVKCARMLAKSFDPTYNLVLLGFGNLAVKSPPKLLKSLGSNNLNELGYTIEV